jgi:hypothetical protein
MITLKKDIDPIGCIVLVRCKVNGEDFQWSEFKVHDISNESISPLLHMEVNENEPGLQQFLTLPLTSFDQRVFSLCPEDQFWTVQNAVQA